MCVCVCVAFDNINTQTLILLFCSTHTHTAKHTYNTHNIQHNTNTDNTQQRFRMAMVKKRFECLQFCMLVVVQWSANIFQVGLTGDSTALVLGNDRRTVDTFGDSTSACSNVMSVLKRSPLRRNRGRLQYGPPGQC